MPRGRPRKNAVSKEESPKENTEEKQESGEEVKEEESIEQPKVKEKKREVEYLTLDMMGQKKESTPRIKRTVNDFVKEYKKKNYSDMQIMCIVHSTYWEKHLEEVKEALKKC
ncbi:MAG: hypothetical protein AABY32_04450 [Nanoarchaeota archaeon]